MHAPSVLLPLLVLVAGCVPPTAPKHVGARFVPQGGVTVALDPVAGPVPLMVPVRVVNAWGAPVPSDPVDVTVGGATTSVSFDPYGYGHVEVDDPGDVTVSAGDVSVTAEALDGGAALPDLPRAVPSAGDVLAVVPASRGMLVATADTVWFVGADGSRYPVLSPPDGGIVGLRAAHLDQDGVIDAVVWTADTVVLLRGRPEGGAGWSAALRAPGWQVGGAAAGDCTGDHLPDVAVAWTHGSDQALEVWEANGPESWAPAVPATLSATPVGLAVGDNVGLGRAQVTITAEDGEWSRFVRSSDGRYWLTGPAASLLSLDLAPGTVPESAGDYNGDGADELFLFGPRVDGTERTFAVWDLLASPPSVFQVTATGGWGAFADANGDGLVDLWTLDETGTLSLLSWANGANGQQPVAALPEGAPFAATDVDGDHVPDVLLGGQRTWSVWPGARAGDGTWSVAPDPVRATAAQGERAVVAADLDGDPSTVEVATFSEASGSTTVDLYRASVGPDPSLTLAASTSIAGTPIDLATCDGIVYSLTSGGLVAMTWDGTTITKTATRAQSGQRLACGDGPGGAKVAVLDQGVATLSTADLVVTDTRQVPGAQGLGFAQGSSGPDLVTCDTPGCTVVQWPWGASGEVALAHTDAQGIAVAQGDVVTRLDGPLALASGDVDGDGHADLVASGGGWIAVYPSTGSGFGTGWSFHADPAPVGSPALVDLTGDGADDLVWVDTAGNLVIAGH